MIKLVNSLEKSDLPAHTKELGTVSGAWGKAVSFLQGCVYWEVDYTPVDGSTPMNIWAAQIISRLFKKKSM